MTLILSHIGTISQSTNAGAGILIKDEHALFAEAHANLAAGFSREIFRCFHRNVVITGLYRYKRVIADQFDCVGFGRDGSLHLTGRV